MLISFNMAAETPLSKNYQSTGLADYVSNVLKSQFGSSEDFLAFERHFYYQIEELNSHRNTCEQLRGAVSKLQEDKRSLELQLVSEKASRDQEAKNAAMEIEKNNVQQNAQMYSIKCEAESWKRKADATNAECTLLKEQMRAVEMEKNQAMHKLVELKSSVNEFERCRQSFEPYSRRLRDLIQLSNKRLDELEKAKESFTKITESNQKQLDMMSSQLRNWSDERTKSQRKILELENELMTTKAELVQNNSKLERAQIKDKQTSDVVKKLMEENKDLQNGLTILSSVVGDQVTEVDQQLLQKTKILHQKIDASVKRLFLNASDFAPQLIQDDEII